MANETVDTKTPIYERIAAFVKAKTGKNIGRSGGQELFNQIVADTFAAAVTAGTFRFNGGYGSLRMKEYQAGSRRLPSGTNTTFGKRRKLRYEQGVTTTALVDGKPVKAPEIPAPKAEPAPKAAAATPASPGTSPAPVSQAAASAAAPADNTLNLD